MKKIVVIGMSAASVAFVTKLRTFDKESEVLCFSGESTMPYNRCLLADFLTGDMSQDQLTLKPDDFFTEQNITIKLNSWVTKIDTQHKKVLAQDVWYPYDILFLGMGTKTVIPKFMQDLASQETALQGLYNFHAMSDIELIKNYIAQYKPKTALVIGAGLNGIEAVSSLVQLGMTVSVVELNKQILPGQVDDATATWVSELMQHHAVTLITGQKAVGICQNENRVAAVRLESGTTVAADLVVVAAGSQVQSQILQDTQIHVQNGCVVVDQHLRTNIPDVFAAGDLCLVRDMLKGDLTRSTTWSDAMLQGLCAATTLSQAPRAYPGIIGLRDSYFFGSYFYACGQTDFKNQTVHHDSTVEVITKVDGQHLKKLYIQNNQLIGFVLIGDISNLAEYKKLYMSKQIIDVAGLKQSFLD